MIPLLVCFLQKDAQSVKLCLDLIKSFKHFTVCIVPGLCQSKAKKTKEPVAQKLDMVGEPNA